MLSQSQLKDLNINSDNFSQLYNPLFATKTPLWTKCEGHLSSIFYRNLKKYEFTKIGKTLGFQTTRFLALSKKTLYYFNQESSEYPLGSCDIQYVYSEWVKLQENRYLLVLNNGQCSTAYFFGEESFIRENGNELARYTVQLGFYSKYNIIEELGEGSFATVYRVSNNSTNEHYSAKIFDRGTPLPALKHQIQILRQIIGVHHVCQYEGIFQTDSQIIVLTKFLPGRDLRTVINNCSQFTYSEIKTILFGVCYGLYQFHKLKIIHRDIKPQNIIIDLDTLEPTIIDFGLSLDLKKSFTLSRCGTNSYMAPEVYNFPLKNEPYNFKCDIFSLGIIAHLLMNGNNPLKSSDEKQLIDRSSNFNWNQLKAKHIWGQKGHEFLSKTLNESVCDRWNISQVLNSQFLGNQKQFSLKKTDSCSTLQERPLQIDI